jgi:flagellin
MSITRINQNIAALNAQRNLAANSSAIEKSIERLSSGLKINRGADDPSGLILSEILRSQVSGLDKALSNATEGVNLVKTAEGALNELNLLLRQMHDLSLDAASEGNNDANSRAALQLQVESAMTTIDYIASTTVYGSKKLLDGSAGTSALIVDTTNIASASAVGTTPAGLIDLDVTTAATKAQHDGTNTYTAQTDHLDNAGSISINGVAIGTFTTADHVSDVIAAVNAKANDTGVTAQWDTNHVELNQQSFGSDKGIVYVESADVLNGGSTVAKYGVDARATVTYGDATTESFAAGHGLQLVGSTSGMTINLTTAGNGTGVDPQDAILVTQGTLEFQVGADRGQQVSIQIASVATSALGTTAALSTIDISTVAGAEEALTITDEAMKQVSELRGKLGAFQANQLEETINSLSVARENLAASESSIRDADFGVEMAAFTRNQILVQSATAFLAQANALPQAVLSLIGAR